MNDWRSTLNSMIKSRVGVTRAEQENAAFEQFLDAVALPALNELAEELITNHQRNAQVRRAPASVTLQVRDGEEEEITFRVMKHFAPNGILPRAEVRMIKGNRYVKYSSMFKPDPQNYNAMEVTQEEIIYCFLKYYGMVMNGGKMAESGE
ncbi:MAG: hypothetical protein IJU44_05590 [Kiritimatiellae bacterium]|nr:hypothetical protein [Kiritimatiellia bacterium]